MILMAIAFSMLGAADASFPAALVEFTPYVGNPVFTAAGPGHWDERIRERGWILHEGDEYRLWYTGYEGESGLRKLGCATSKDGLSWTRYPGNPIYDAYWVEDMMVVKVDGVYYMFAEGENDIGHLLTSPDGIHWTRKGPLDIRMVNGEPIAPGPFGTLTAWYEDGVWRLFYERNDVAIWLAQSRDLTVWTNVQDEPVIKRGPDAYDLKMIALDQIVKCDGRYYAYYHGLIPDQKPDEWTSAVAVSTDLIHWAKYAGNPIVRGDRSSPELVPDENGFRLYTMHPDICVYFPKAASREDARATK